MSCRRTSASGVIELGILHLKIAYMNQTNKNLWGCIVAAIIAGSAGISIYKAFAEAQLNVITLQNTAAQKFRAQPEIQNAIENANNLAATIRQHKTLNDSAIAKGIRGGLYNDKITELTKAYNEIVVNLNKGEDRARDQFKSMAALKNEGSFIGWLSSIAIAVTMPLCAWLLCFFSERLKDKMLATIMFLLSFICEFVSAITIHDGLMIMLNDAMIANTFAATCAIVLPFVYKGISRYAFETKQQTIVRIFNTNDLPRDWREFVINWRRGEVAPDLPIATVASHYQRLGVIKLSSTKLFKELTNGRIVPLNWTEKDLNQQPTYQTNEREG